MRIAIMQPYLFPYLGYFSLIKNTDHFVFFDTPQYIRKGWINRNRILSAKGDDIYFSVPVKKCVRETPIKDVQISYDEKWIDKWKGQMTSYKKRAPYYNDVMDLLNDVLNADDGLISHLAICSVVKTCEYIQIPLEYEIYSQISEPNEVVFAPDEWALNISQRLGYSTYINPPGGKSFFDKKKYDDQGIELQFLTQNLPEYGQRTKKGFVPGLSILDVMMFCAPNEIAEMLNDYTLD